MPQESQNTDEASQTPTINGSYLAKSKPVADAGTDLPAAV